MHSVVLISDAFFCPEFSVRLQSDRRPGGLQDGFFGEQHGPRWSCALHQGALSARQALGHMTAVDGQCPDRPLLLEFAKG